MQYTPALETSLNIPKFTNTVTIYYLKEISFVLKRGTRNRILYQTGLTKSCCSLPFRTQSVTNNLLSNKTCRCSYVIFILYIEPWREKFYWRLCLQTIMKNLRTIIPQLTKIVLYCIGSQLWMEFKGFYVLIRKFAKTVCVICW